MSRSRRIFLFLVALLFGYGHVLAADPLQASRDALSKGDWQSALAAMPKLDPLKNSASAFMLRSQIYVLQSDWYLARKEYGAALAGADAAMSDAIIARAGWQRFIVHRKRAIIFKARKAPNDLVAAANELLAANTLAAQLKAQ